MLADSEYAVRSDALLSIFVVFPEPEAPVLGLLHPRTAAPNFLEVGEHDFWDWSTVIRASLDSFSLEPLISLYLTAPGGRRNVRNEEGSTNVSRGLEQWKK